MTLEVRRVPSASAVRRNLVTEVESEEWGRPDPAPTSEPARYQQRHRVVLRRSSAPRTTRRVRPFQGVSVLGVIPGLFLLVYVLFWVFAMRGGYYRDNLKSRITAIRIEQADLDAEKRRLQAPAYILQRAAAELGMQPAVLREYERERETQQFAQENMGR